ncbi:uncharacterized protein E0L32_005639 [Thyridium curvatum]|uniref:Biogenesis of lysosome-related organelles complex 1 subunit CNL1 n=1 Tax=Thyridium curvatum TaxID=1093900 RepID=A0A507B968_9PEZI|nr:uncharacterized protein E0L32_005639 [Thyridium curvatum]TPX13939.1 hypothetical protein E0L32_005639 [Thyridium curvatum]
MSATSVQAVDPSQLGLSNEELFLLRQGQSAALAGGGGSSSSRAASRASSQGLLVMDTSSLAALARHFDHLMANIQQQLEYLGQESATVTMYVYDQAGQLVENADAEIARYTRLLKQMDDLEVEFDRIRHIRDIVSSFKQRAQEMERELERSQPSGSSSRHRDRDRQHHSSSSRHGHSHSHSHGHRHGHTSSSSRR